MWRRAVNMNDGISFFRRFDVISGAHAWAIAANVSTSITSRSMFDLLPNSLVLLQDSRGIRSMPEQSVRRDFVVQCMQSKID